MQIKRNFARLTFVRLNWKSFCVQLTSSKSKNGPAPSGNISSATNVGFIIRSFFTKSQQQSLISSNHYFRIKSFVRNFFLKQENHQSHYDCLTASVNKPTWMQQQSGNSSKAYVVFFSFLFCLSESDVWRRIKIQIEKKPCKKYQPDGAVVSEFQAKFENVREFFGAKLKMSCRMCSMP